MYSDIRLLLACAGFGRVSMSAEKFFCGESSAFLFVFWRLLWFLNGVSGFVRRFLA